MRPCKTKAVMADKGGKTAGAGVKPVPMKLFATWEVEKSTPNCIPRLVAYFIQRFINGDSVVVSYAAVHFRVSLSNSADSSASQLLSTGFVLSGGDFPGPVVWAP